MARRIAALRKDSARMVKLRDPLAALVDRVNRVLKERRWKKTAFAHGKVSPNTVRSVLQGRNCRLSTLVEMADALDCDLVIDLQPRPPVDGTVEYPQDTAHET